MKRNGREQGKGVCLDSQKGKRTWIWSREGAHVHIQTLNEDLSDTD